MVGLQPYVPQAAALQRCARPAYLRGEHGEYAQAEERAAVCEERAPAGHDVIVRQAGKQTLDVERAEDKARDLAERVPY